MAKQPGYGIKTKYDEAATGLASKLWQGTLAVAASGFGKGVLLAGAIVLAIAAASMGLNAYAGNVMVPSGLGGTTVATVGQGIAAGLMSGIGMLGTGIGVGILAIGGTLGAVTQAIGHQNRITAEVAKAQAKQYELSRQLAAQPAMQMQPELSQPQSEADCGCWKERIAAGRAQNTNGIAV